MLDRIRTLEELEALLRRGSFTEPEIARLKELFRQAVTGGEPNSGLRQMSTFEEVELDLASLGVPAEQVRKLMGDMNEIERAHQEREREWRNTDSQTPPTGVDTE